MSSIVRWMPQKKSKPFLVLRRGTSLTKTKMSSNPFSSRFIQPGAMAYEFFGRGSIQSLSNEFLALRSRRGMIVGPHGTGKSTLLDALQQDFLTRFPDIPLVHERFTRTPDSSRGQRVSASDWPRDSIVILDGYEQVSLWSRWWLQRASRQKRIRLLVTAHESLRSFDLLWRTSVDDQSAEWIVKNMLQISNQKDLDANLQLLLSSKEWLGSRAQHGQNIRETLFDMYDWWQSRAR